MIYLYIDKYNIKLLSLKKTILGQQEISFFQKKYETLLIKEGKIESIDLLASAIKEAINLAKPSIIFEKNVCLILPQESFFFLRCEVPVDIATSAINAFIKDKARAKIEVNLDETINDYYVVKSDKQKFINFYALRIDDLEKLNQAFFLTDLKIEKIIPDTLAYFKLFEKTLRREKKETIFYVFYEKDTISGYLFDSLGLLQNQKWSASLSNQNIENILKEKVNQLAKENIKINRIILSGSLSEKVRQDIFTKSVGVWTNPLKRIISNFYNDYLKLLIINPSIQLPILDLDMCFGAFIFSQESKGFSISKKNAGNKIKKMPNIALLSLLKKELLIFLASFLLSFLFFILISNLNLKTKLSLPKINITPTPTTEPSPTPTPTPAFKKEDLKIKVLNGSGVRGKAGDVKEILKNIGYGEILTDNADNFDYKITQINVKKDKIQAAILIKNDLKDYISSPKIGQLSENENADVVIIIGQDFK